MNTPNLFPNGLQMDRLEPLGPFTLLTAMTELAEREFVPQVERIEHLTESGIFSECHLVGVNLSRLIERERVERNCFGKDVLAVDSRALDYDTEVTHRLHKMGESDWWPYVLETATYIHLAVNGLPVTWHKLSRELSPEDQARAEDIARRVEAIEVPMDEWTENHASVVCLKQAGNKDRAVTLDPIKKRVKNASASFGKVKVLPEHAVRPNEFKFGDWKSCSRAATETVYVRKGEQIKRFGKMWAERYTFDQESGSGFREECRWEPFTNTMRLYRERVDVTVDTFCYFPELAEYHKLADSVMAAK
jgi:hypothetical protein